METEKPKKELQVNIEQEFSGIDYDPAEFERIVKSVCLEFGVDFASINVVVVGDDKIVEVNQQFLKRDSATDVISFDLSEGSCGVKLFDIVVNGERAIRQAEKRGIDSRAELGLYIVHGLLHNLGFDDMTEAEALEMHDMEDKLLTKYGFGKVYNVGL